MGRAYLMRLGVSLDRFSCDAFDTNPIVTSLLVMLQNPMNEALHVISHWLKIVILVIAM